MNINSKRFIITLLAMLIWTLIVTLMKVDMLTSASSLAILIGPYLTLETIKKSTQKKEPDL